MAKIRFIQKEFHFLIFLFLLKVGRRVPFPLFHDCYSIGSVVLKQAWRLPVIAV